MVGQLFFHIKEAGGALFYPKGGGRRSFFLIREVGGVIFLNDKGEVLFHM